MKKWIAILFLFLPVFLPAQQPKMKLSGSVGAEARFYRYGQFNTVREKFFGRIYGRPTVQVKNWKLPFSFNFGDYQKRYLQAFNKFGVSPTNGWLTFHLGHRTVPFSSITLGNHNFFGGGVEIQPKHGQNGFRGAAVYGKFLKPVEPDTSLPLFIPLSYQRTGFAAKAGFGSRREFIDIIYFSGHDNESSVEFDPDVQGKTPAANTVIGINGAVDIFKDLFARLEIGWSAYTRDTRLPSSEAPDNFNAAILAPFVDQNLSTQFTSAIKSRLRYRLQSHQIHLMYDRINPGYQTMGTYFFRDDVERIRIGGRFRFAQNKMMVMPELGWEHNDLLQSKFIRNGRTIAGLRAYYRKNQLTVSGNIRNYTVSLRQQSAITADSLLLRQINTNFGVNGSYRFDEQGRRSANGGIRFMTTGQNAADTTIRQYRNLGIRGQYKMKLPSPELTLTPGGRIHIIRSPFFNSTRYQPYVGVATTFVGDQLKVHYNLAIILATVSGSAANTGWRNLLHLSYQLMEKHTLDLRIAYLWNIPAGLAGAATYSEFQGNLGYRVQF